ncbi:MAG: chorismate synthase, partial [Coriobacteriia bacterium]|nr:chorismate synthase [Coriobacteriia bacterium]
IEDEPFGLHPTQEDFDLVAKKHFPTIDDAAGDKMQHAIKEASANKDSVGGIIECAAIGVPIGLGSPMFEGIENKLAAAIFGIPAVKGIEFGSGFESARQRGSEHNDPIILSEQKDITMEKNDAGGINGGITNGMPIRFNVAFKPTPSISKPQKSVHLTALEETELIIHGRHDPCVAHRAVPVVEAVAALVLLDCLLEHHGH